MSKNYVHQGTKVFGHRNLYDDCFQEPPSKVIDGICAECRNPECVRAGHGASLWQIRMNSQVRYLLNSPNISDVSTDEHKRIAQLAIPELKQKQSGVSLVGSWDLRKADEEWESDLPASLGGVAEPAEPPPKPTEPLQPAVPRRPSRNTQVSSDGVMLGGAKAPAEAPDPWANADKFVSVVAPGSVITLK